MFCYHSYYAISRELAIQIHEQFEALGSGIGVKCAVVRFWPKLVSNYTVTFDDFIIHIIFQLHDGMQDVFPSHK